MKNFIIYHLPMILFGGIIITISSIPDLKSPDTEIFALDKLAHFLEYAFFAFLTFRSFSRLSPRLSLNYAFLTSVAFITLFSFGDEYYQSFIPGRHSDLGDTLADITGAVLVITYFWLRHRRLYHPTS